MTGSFVLRSLMPGGVLALCVMACGQAGFSSQIIWDFDTPIPPGQESPWVPHGWITEGRYGREWTITNSTSSSGGFTPLGLNDGLLAYSSPGDDVQPGDADIFTPAFRFTDLASAVVRILDIEITADSPLLEVDQIDFHLVHAEHTSAMVARLWSISPATTVDEPRSSPLIRPIDKAQDGIDEETFYRIRIRASDPDGRHTILSRIGDIVVTFASGDADYNGDGIANAADYTVWRDSLGQQTSTSGLPADGNLNYMVDRDDYLVWRSSFGKVTSGTGGSAEGALPTPEPSSTAIIACGLAWWCLLRTGRRTRSEGK